MKNYSIMRIMKGKFSPVQDSYEDNSYSMDEYSLDNLSIQELIEMRTPASLTKACYKLLDECQCYMYKLEKPVVVEFYKELLSQAEYLPPVGEDKPRATEYALGNLGHYLGVQNEDPVLGEIMDCWKSGDCRKALLMQATAYIDNWEKYKDDSMGLRNFQVSIYYKNVIMTNADNIDILYEKAVEAQKAVQQYAENR